MRLAVISSSPFNLYAATLVDRLAADGRTPVAIICTQPSRMATVRGYVRKHGLLRTVDRALDVIGVRPSRANWIRRTLGQYAAHHGLTHWDAPLRKVCKHFGVDFLRVESVNAAAAVAYVRRRAIDVLLNAGSELFRREIIDASQHGILNAHMGYLPTYRGYNVLEWSLFRGDQIGVSLHFIDTGVDTGDIVRFHPIAVELGDTLTRVRAKAFPIDVDLMLDAVRGLERGTLPRTPQAEGEGKQYFTMHPRLRAVAEKRILVAS
jgi:folate-dependent phosphoribosylglycinamide formyltransferase PurN